MDYKALGKNIIIVGLLICLGGGGFYLANKTEKFDSSKSPKSIFGGRDDMFNALSVMGRNITREENRSNAFKIMIGGGAFAF